MKTTQPRAERVRLPLCARPLPPRLISTLLLLGGLSPACSAADDAGGDSADADVQIAALETNEDGSDLTAADASNDAPRLLRGCSLARIRASLAEPGLDDDSDAVRPDRQEGLEGHAQRRRASADGEQARPSEVLAPMHDRATRRLSATRAVRLQLLTRIYDTDASGALDASERAELESDLEARCANRLARLLEQFDADGSGDLDPIEWQTAHAAIRERYLEHRAQLLARFDTNDDGRLDADERRQAQVALADEITAIADAIALRFDDNGDGLLQEDENLAYIEYLRSAVRGEVSLDEFIDI